jgi:hypothetical protein
VGEGLYVDSQSWDVQLARNDGNKRIEQYTNILNDLYSVEWFSTCRLAYKIPETINASLIKDIGRI